MGKGPQLAWKASILPGKSKNQSAQWSELHAILLAVMEELNSDKKACMFDFLLTNGQWLVVWACGQQEGNRHVAY